MFEGHVDTHLRCHHADLVTENPLSSFIRGARDTHPKPGGQTQTYGRARIGKGGRRKGQVLVTPTDDGPEASDEDPIVSLSEIIES